ncbi:MAG TPA: metal ABC transporter ATP-binding protein [Thermoplasmata archaeon]|nr:metal ABC transporter ATP-binding protein [Thermoplasmata archaeon]
MGGTFSRPTVPSDAASSIRAFHLTVGYRKRRTPVWQDANFEIRTGEFVAVIGPNGSGKTTLFRMLLGLQRPARGRLEVFGEAPRRGNPRIGYVPQRHTIDTDTHVAADALVRLGATGTRWGPGISIQGPKEAAAQALAAVGASELGHRALGALSGGELQRVFLAEALAGNPEMLLLDEPLSNLDLRRSRELVEVVHELVRARHVTTLLVAHDINPLIRCLDKVIYIANGRVATGRPDEVLTSESLTALYGVTVEVLHDSRGNIVIVGGENPHEANA